MDEVTIIIIAIAGGLGLGCLVGCVWMMCQRSSRASQYRADDDKATAGEDEHVAASRIQKMFRNHSQRKSEEAAATKIQSRYRGHSLRRKRRGEELPPERQPQRIEKDVLYTRADTRHQDAYDILQVDPGASAREIQLSYDALVRSCKKQLKLALAGKHEAGSDPDVMEAVAQFMEGKLRELELAKQQLDDPSSRAKIAMDRIERAHRAVKFNDEGDDLAAPEDGREVVASFESHRLLRTPSMAD